MRASRTNGKPGAAPELGRDEAGEGESKGDGDLDEHRLHVPLPSHHQRHPPTTPPIAIRRRLIRLHIHLRAPRRHFRRDTCFRSPQNERERRQGDSFCIMSSVLSSLASEAEVCCVALASVNGEKASPKKEEPKSHDIRSSDRRWVISLSSHPSSKKH